MSGLRWGGEVGRALYGGVYGGECGGECGGVEVCWYVLLGGSSAEELWSSCGREGSFEGVLRACRAICTDSRSPPPAE